MKDINKITLPDDLYYAKSHEWVRKDTDQVTIGISDYAQDQLGDVVFVELPEVGACFQQGDELGSVESVKAVSELYIPVGGEVIKINEAVADNPALVNESPYDEGWLLKIKTNNENEFDSLMKKDDYLSLLQGE